MKSYSKFNAVVPGESLRLYYATMSDNDGTSGDREVDRDDLVDLLER